MRRLICRLFGHRYTPWFIAERHELSQAAAEFVGTLEPLDAVERRRICERCSHVDLWHVFEYRAEPGFVPGVGLVV